MNQHMSRFFLDMRWFFHQAKSEIGIRSSWDPLVQLALTGGSRGTSTGTSDREERRRGAVFRHARIEQALRSMATEHIRMIRLTCEEPTHTLRLAYGDLGNAAHLTQAARSALRDSRSTREITDWLDRLSVRYAAGRAVSASLDAIDSIRLGCEEIMEPAREAYVRALGKIPNRRAA